MTPAITCEQLRVSYGALNVLRGVSFTIPAGQGVVLLGANGCGKSTLMRSLNGLEKLQSGKVLIHGANLVCNPPRGCARPRRSGSARG